MYVRIWMYSTLHIIIHIDVLPGDAPVGMGFIDDDVATYVK